MAAFKSRENCLFFGRCRIGGAIGDRWLPRRVPFTEAWEIACHEAAETACSARPVNALILADAGPLVRYVA